MALHGLHGLHQVGHRRFQPLPADAVGGFPDHDHRLTDRLIVDALTPCLTRNLVVLVKLPEQPDAVFAMVAGYGDEFIEDTALVLLGGSPVAISQCDQQFPLCHPAYASTHVAASDFSVTFYLRQLLSLGNVLGEAMRMPR